MIGSQVIHPNIQVTDITQQFHVAANKLPPGQLVKDEYFTLFDAVAALEIGDAKMDSGCEEVQSRLPVDFNPRGPISAGEVIWVIDQLLRREAAWHLGYPISQTIFTSVHIDKLLWPDPKELSDAKFVNDPYAGTVDVLRDEVLRAYLLGLIKCCDAVHSVITSQHYYEEEDFASQTFNRELLHRFAASDVIDILQGACDRIQLLDISTPDRQALLCRLRFRFMLLNMFQSHSNVGPLSPAKVNEAQNLLSEQIASAPQGRPVPSAFSLRIQHRMASSIPPRPTIITEEAEAYRFWRQILTDSATVFELLQATAAEDLFQSLWSFMSQKPQPVVYIRSLAQSLLDVDQQLLGTIPPKEFIIQDMRTLVLPANRILDPANSKIEAESDKRHQLANLVNSFVIRYEQSFINLFRAYALNRCRVRRTLCHSVVEWDSIQVEAESIDEQLQTLVSEQPITFLSGQEKTFSYCLSSWVYHYKLVQLRLIIQMGFELSVYAPHEYAGMYWYLSHICETHIGHLERISHFITHSNLKPARRLSQAQIEEERRIALSRLYRIFAWLTATVALAKSLHLLYTALQRCGKFTKTTTAYASDELRFEIRMKPFMGLSLPEPLSYAEWNEAIEEQELSTTDLLDRAGLSSSSAKKSWEEILKSNWHCFDLDDRQKVNGPASATNVESVAEREWKAEIRSSMKASIATSLAIHYVSKFVNDKAKSSNLDELKVRMPIPGDKDCWHAWWIVPSVSR